MKVGLHFCVLRFQIADKPLGGRLGNLPSISRLGEEGDADFFGTVEGVVEVDVEEGGGVGGGGVCHCDVVEEEGVLGEVGEAHQADALWDVEALVSFHLEAVFLGDVAFEDNEGIILHEDCACGRGVYA